MDRNEFIENLRTTLLWENVCSHIESGNDANVLLQMAGLEHNITAESAFIQDSEDFYITAISENSNKMVIEFEMPFILCVNEKYNIEAVATGKLDIPDIESYPYDKYDFDSMTKKELLFFGSIICISSIIYREVELIGVVSEKQQQK
ncbi:MAG: hypothetical protein K2K70_11630 [Lachnospiraceae bacterium]|nr:hypothetical protein [Lachnospiraceae bacterium]